MNKHLPLTPTWEYVFIDSLYTDTFKQADAAVLRDTGLAELRPVLFPYTDDPYALFRADDSAFDLARIRYVDASEGETCALNQFCSDSGLILVVETACFYSFLHAFDAEQFVFDYLESAAESPFWTAFLATYAHRFFWFYTAELQEAFAGGGNFQID